MRCLTEREEEKTLEYNNSFLACRRLLVLQFLIPGSLLFRMTFHLS